MPSRELLTDTQLDEALADLEGWSRDGDAIRRDFEFADFVAALGFIVQVGLLAEKMDHHPNLTNVYNRVGIALSTHDRGGVTGWDIELARAINARM
jgi:4a-hydroxytetrahydrobiopterin dehydratase